MIHRQLVSIFLVCLVAVLVFSSTTADDCKLGNERMIGGEIINIDEEAYMVQVRTIYTFGCGGTLVTPQHVVTAAHCLDHVDPKRHLFVVGGANTSNGQGVARRIADFFIPGEYVRGKYHADVAVLKLDSPMPENSHVHSIPLCSKAMKPGDEVRVSGWGRTVANGMASQELRTITFPIITNEECSKKLKLSESSNKFNLTETMVCGMALKAGPCKGDSGGPVVHNDKLCAVVSWGKSDCVYDDTPAVYTSIEAVRSFLEDALMK